MKKCFYGIVIICCCTVSAIGQTKHENVQKLMSLTMQKELIDKYFANMSVTLVQQLKAQFPDSASSNAIQEFMTSTMERTKLIVRKMIDEDVVTIYENQFSEQEIKDLIKFYESPTGKAMIAKMPEIQKEMMMVMSQKYMPQFKDEVSKAVEKISATKENQ